MTLEEFNNLRFGDKVWNENGDWGVVVDNNTSGSYLIYVHFKTGQYDCFTKDEILLEKPKKLILKEVEGYILEDELRVILDPDSFEDTTDLYFSKEKIEENDIKVKIIFEIEE